MNDFDYMKLAIELAKKGEGYVNPNPMVGAVIVKDGKIIGQGWHERYGGLHAEPNAIKSCSEPPKGATLYVTLEPCCHYGKTPPCTEAIIQSGTTRVVIGTLDTNPMMAGKSMELLRQQGILVEVGILEEECKRLIKVFRKFITTKRPFVLMKYAMTMDGKIATYTNHSKWISCEEARRQVHKLRHSLSAIMVGVNTVICDNPELTCRMENGRNPIRIVCDTDLRTPLSAKLVKTAREVPTYIATSCEEEGKQRAYQKEGCELICIGKKENHLDLTKLMIELGKREIDSVLLEGGATLNWTALKEQLVDEVQVYLAPKIFGGNGKTPVAGLGIAMPEEAIRLKPYGISQIGSDYLIESEVVYLCSQES
jgi:diaminohydroxyphosphoribosylaminopyrimidine deaminase/5-amino-6-(5-phosphoribosylamino)uracil reductase